MQIFQAIKSRQPIYLADPDWTDLPWKNIPKTPFDQLLDRTATLANLYVQGFKIEGLKSTSLLHAALEIATRCWKIEADLRHFYENLERANHGPLYWPKFSTDDNPADDAEHGKVFPVAFHFPNLKMAFTCMMYWASLNLAWAVLAQVYQLLRTQPDHDSAADSQADGLCHLCSEEDGIHQNCNCGDESASNHATRFNINQLPPLEARIDVLSMARNICQSVEYCMQEEMKAMGPAATVIPLLAAIDVLASISHCSRELSWAKAAFARVNGRGFRLMNHLDRQ